MKFFLRFAILSSVITANLNAQSFPEQIHSSTDGRMLFTGNKPATGLYDSAIVRSVYLEFPQADYWQLLRQNYNSQTEIPARMTVDGLRLDSVGVRFKGETSYLQLPANAQKMSFNISVDFVRPEQRLMGYKTLNFHNAFQDESFLREVFFLYQSRKHIPAAKANFINLYINGEYWGPYPNIQQLNKDFLGEWFLSNDGCNWRAERPGITGPGGPWGDGTAALNFLGADTSRYQQYYNLKSSDVPGPWSKLAAACDALNNTPAANLPDVLPKYFDIDRVLWHLATEIAFSDDDSYVHKGKNDFYVYFEPETGRITLVECDGNSVMNPGLANWSPFYNEAKVNYPLLNKVLAVPQWRQRYLAHLRTIIAEEMDPQACNVILDNLRRQIEPFVQNDPKKLYPYQRFIDEFPVLRNFIASRRNFLFANPEVAQIAPAISDVRYINTNGQLWTPPAALEKVAVQAKVSAATGLHQVNLYYSNQIVGNFTQQKMYDDGLHGDGASGDGVFGASIPGQAAGAWVRFYIEAVAANAARTVAYLPQGAEHNVFVYAVKTSNVANVGVKVNELMASNTKTVKDEAGEYEDWIELYNLSDQDIDLSGYFLSDNPANLPKWEIRSGTIIPAKGFLTFWADEDGSQGPRHCNFKLSAGGEVVILLDRDRNIVDSVAFGAQEADRGYARVPDGAGSFRIQSPTFGASNELATALVRPHPLPGALEIYPNPTSSRFVVKVPGARTDRLLEVFDSGGSAVLRRQALEENILDTTSWPAGLYFIRCGNAAGRVIVMD
ncbi:MAG: CotH kinase family protein [Saprospiraceae bacterium]